MDAQASAGRRPTLLSQRLDRIAFVAYLLGGVVPLASTAWLIHRHEASGPNAGARIALAVSIGALSLGAFLALRLSVHRALARMASDLHRQSALLETSTALEAREDLGEAAATIARRSLCLVRARGALVCRPAPRGGPPEITEVAGLEREHAVMMTRAWLRDPVEAVLGGAPSARTPHGGLVLPLQGEEALHGALVVLPREDDPRFDVADCEALATLARLGSLALGSADLRHAQRNFFAHVVDLLCAALDAHDEARAGHSHRVARWANLLGHRLGLSERRREHLHFAALLHDLGRLRIERSQLDSPAAERDHARLGYEMLREIRLWEDSAPIVLAHHERHDGSGCPDGRRGDGIPLEARILAVADTFDELTSGFGGAEALTSEDALAAIADDAGTAFDPAVVAALRGIFTAEAAACDHAAETQPVPTG